MRQPSARFLALAALAAVALAQAPQTKPAFEMADIHPSPDVQQGIGAFRGIPWSGNGRWEWRTVTLLDLVSNAWDVTREKVLGGPAWIEWDQFDITAKMPADSTPDVQKAMLQSLLADRFRLAVHNETKELPAYTLTASKTPKMKPSDGPGDTGCRSQISGPGVTPMPGGGFRIDNTAGPIMNAFTCHNMTMDAFATWLRPQVSQNGNSSPVENKTDLKGAWDFEFKISLQIRMLNAAPASDMITIYDAVDKQLGLKLNAIKVPLPVVVIDSAEKPSPNMPGVTEALALKHPKEFEVADVRPADPTVPVRRIQILRGGGVNFAGMPLRVLILNAYSLRNDMLIAAPAMQTALDSMYTVVAKPPVSDDAPPAPAPAGAGIGPMAISSPDDSEAAWSMMRVLLEDRFKLKMHKEERPLTAWKLIAVKPKMKKADPSGRTKTGEGPGADGKDPRTITPARSRLTMFQNVTMDQFAEKLQGISAYLQTPVINATGLEGAYDFTISYSPVGITQIPGGGGRGGPGPGAEGNGSAAADEPNGAITLFEAIEQQLGLKLVEDKRPVTVYVIDHIEEKPTDN